jgi:hypothetical protein
MFHFGNSGNTVFHPQSFLTSEKIGEYPVECPLDYEQHLDARQVYIHDFFVIPHLSCRRLRPSPATRRHGWLANNRMRMVPDVIGTVFFTRFTTRCSAAILACSDRFDELFSKHLKGGKGTDPGKLTMRNGSE